MKKLLLLTIAILLSGCAVTQEITMNQSDGEYGELVIQFSDNIKNVRATVDDQLVRTEKKLTKELILYNIPAGKRELHIAASSWELRDDVDFRETIDIKDGQQSAVIVNVPPKSGGYWAMQVASYLVTMSIILQTTNR
ncbi:MAG: hypothetical protein WEA58_11020 [Balneolaceae bacterium]